MIKTREENPDGLHQKYLISKVDGSDIDTEAEYFVLRIDKAGERNHVNACLKALKVYSNEIENSIPKLANDLREKYKL